MKRPLLSIRWRLTLFSTALVVVLLTALAFFLYTTLVQNYYSELDRTLADRADQLSRTSYVQRNGPYNQRVIAPVLNVFADSDTFLQVTDAKGDIQVQSSNLDRAELPVPQDVSELVSSGQPRYESIMIGNVPIRLYSAPAYVNGQPTVLIQVARITKGLAETTQQLRTLLIVGIAMAVLISIVAGHYLSGRALRPIVRVTRAAREIGEQRDFKRRVPYVGPDDEVGKMAGTFNTMLTELEAAYADVNNALSAQRRFVADASHELRTPLTAIRGNAELLQRVPDMDPADRQDSIDEMAREAQRMSRLVNNLLALARADAGQQLVKTTFRLSPLIEELVFQARHLSLEVPVYLGPIPEVELHGDRDYVKQLLLILIDNALKYTTPPGWVAISATNGSGTVTIAVEDTGAGIAPEHLPHLFERFYRADSARSNAGTGLGLAIGKWIADQHGAQIQVASEPGYGSVFSVIFPTVTLALPPAAAESEASARTLGTELAAHA